MAYEYDHDCPFEAFITNLGKYNEGELVGEWVKFPTTSEELQKVFERIGIGSFSYTHLDVYKRQGVYRIHQFEKQEMIVVCKPEESKMWYEKLWKNTVDLFCSMDIPVSYTHLGCKREPEAGDGEHRTGYAGGFLLDRSDECI